MTIESMISVKEAATILGCDKTAVKEKLDQGQIKGEKRFEGDKEKWFVLKEDVEAQLAKQNITTPPARPRKRRTASPDTRLYFGVDGKDQEMPIDASIISDVSTQPSLSTVVQVMASEFAKRLDREREISFRLQRELEEKDIQLRLLPDLKKRAEESQLIEHEVAALKKQINCLEAERVHAAVLLDRAEHEIIPQLEERLDEETRLHGLEVMRLREQLQLLEKKRAQEERSQKMVFELETALREVMELREKERRIAQEEMERLSQEKEKETATLAHRLSGLDEQEKKVADLESALACAVEEKENELRAAAEEKERLAQEKAIEVGLLKHSLAQATQHLSAANRPWWRNWFSFRP